MTDQRVSLTLRLPTETWERLRTQAFEERTTITALILDAIGEASPGNEQTPLAEARMWAQHGYELGQRFAYWTDDGFHPDWLTETWRRTNDAR